MTSLGRVYGSSPRRPAASARPPAAAHARVPPSQFDRPPVHARAARRQRDGRGPTSEKLGAIAVAQGQWAAGNPHAQYRAPITLADHQRSRWVAEPLPLLDCSLVSNGAIAVIVTSAETAASGRRPPVHIWGWGQGHPAQPMANCSEVGLVTGAVQAGRAAMGMAGVGPADVTMCQIYDCY